MKKTLLVIMLALLSYTARAEMDGNKLYETALAYERVQDSRTMERIRCKRGYLWDM
jgi:hypothetical protein